MKLELPAGIRTVTKTVTEMGYHDFEELVYLTFPRHTDWSFVASLECGNGCTFNWNADGSDCDDEEVEKWGESGKTWPDPGPSELLDYFVLTGVLPEGEFEISVYW